jgi:hypothetical protein
LTSKYKFKFKPRKEEERKQKNKKRKRKRAAGPTSPNLAHQAQPFPYVLPAVLTVWARLTASRDLTPFTAPRVPYVRASVNRLRLLARAGSVRHSVNVAR